MTTSSDSVGFCGTRAYIRGQQTLGVLEATAANAKIGNLISITNKIEEHIQAGYPNDAIPYINTTIVILEKMVEDGYEGQVNNPIGAIEPILRLSKSIKIRSNEQMRIYMLHILNLMLETGLNCALSVVGEGEKATSPLDEEIIGLLTQAYRAVLDAPETNSILTLEAKKLEGVTKALSNNDLLSMMASVLAAAKSGSIGDCLKIIFNAQRAKSVSWFADSWMINWTARAIQKRANELPAIYTAKPGQREAVEADFEKTVKDFFKYRPQDDLEKEAYIQVLEEMCLCLNQLLFDEAQGRLLEYAAGKRVEEKKGLLSNVLSSPETYSEKVRGFAMEAFGRLAISQFVTKERQSLFSATLVQYKSQEDRKGKKASAVVQQVLARVTTMKAAEPAPITQAVVMHHSSSDEDSGSNHSGSSEKSGGSGSAALSIDPSSPGNSSPKSTMSIDSSSSSSRKKSNPLSLDHIAVPTPVAAPAKTRRAPNELEIWLAECLFDADGKPFTPDEIQTAALAHYKTGKTGISASLISNKLVMPLGTADSLFTIIKALPRPVATLKLKKFDYLDLPGIGQELLNAPNITKVIFDNIPFGPNEASVKALTPLVEAIDTRREKGCSLVIINEGSPFNNWDYLWDRIDEAKEGGGDQKEIAYYKIGMLHQCQDEYLSTFYYNMGLCYQKRDLELSEKYYKHAIMLYPKDEKAFFGLGAVYEELGDGAKEIADKENFYKKSYQSNEQALKLKPNYENALLQKQRILGKLAIFANRS